MFQPNLIEPVLDEARQQKAKEYAMLRRRLFFGELAIVAILLLLLVFGSISQRLTALLTLPAVPGAALYLVLLLVAYGVLIAPLDYYSGFVLPKRYGLSIQKFAAWLGDEAKAKGLSLALGAGGVALIYWFIISFPATWWLLGWVVVVLFGILLTHIAPILIVPLFLKMKPLADDELRLRLERLAERAKTRVRGIYSIEFSRKGTTANAALMGLGNTRRIVLSDTLLQKYSPSEIETVLAHELGHHQHRDIFRLFAVQSAIWLIGFYVASIALRSSVQAFGYSSMADVAALPLLFLVAAAFSALLSPLLNTFSRHVESAADEYALRLTDDPKSFADAMAKLTDQNLSEAQPPRWVELLIYDHPSYKNRLEHAKYYSANRFNQQNQGR